MKDEKKTSFFKKIFGQKTSCCSPKLEEVDSNEVKSSDSRNCTPSCCSSTPNPDLRKNEDKKKRL
ncbi:MAG TPA: hypothetical protein PKW76_11070 [bacterium]|nr:hypothetical protein [bacterium]HOX86881.1 hypothetical protein [bacterium]HPG46212.1 hypothetical protein [bacterium]HPM98594.1 hypothetical protein [bacterium]